MIGVNPGPLTIRELFWMSEGKGRDEWARTSSLMAMIANGIPVVMVSKVGKKAKPNQFNPYAEKKKSGILITKENIGELRDAFAILADQNKVNNGKIKCNPGGQSIR